MLTGPFLARTSQRVVGRGRLVGLAVPFHDQEPAQRHNRDLSVRHRRPPSPRPESFASELGPAGSARRRGQRPSPPPVHRSLGVAATWKASCRLKRSAVGRVAGPVHRGQLPVALDALERPRSAVVQDDVEANDQVADGPGASISSCWAAAITRAAMCTAIPPTSSSRRSTSPTCSPARIRTSMPRSWSPRAIAQWIPRPGPSKVAMIPSPVVLTRRPPAWSISRRASSS